MLYGARRPTCDIDVTPSTAEENLQRLSNALRELQAVIVCVACCHPWKSDDGESPMDERRGVSAN